jgi:coenzyme F420-reducing hydrogenase delta subunit
MLQAFELGADGIFIGESEQKSSPYPHSVTVMKENVSLVRDVLMERNIDPDRVRCSEFVTVMLVPFVDQMNSLSDFARRSGPIADEDRKELVSRLTGRQQQEVV